MNILEQQYPEIFKALSGVSDDDLPRTTLAVAQYVIRKNAVDNPAILDAITHPNPSKCTALAELSQQTEQSYLDAQARGKEDEHLEDFMKARAIDSLIYALSQTSREDAGRSIYEAIAANDGNADEILNSILQSS